MENLEAIINDINLTIADLETLQTGNNVSLPARVSTKVYPETRRAIGQLKAARASLVKAFAVIKSQEEIGAANEPK